MSEERSRYDITAADTKIIGTDFQFFYFIKELLKLKKGQQIGYEAKDDVHIDLPNNNSVLIQLKHTTLKDVSGNIVNLGELDNDLIHTIENWVDVINDSSLNNNSLADKKTFLEKTEFILATNKNIQNNAFIQQIEEVKGDERKIKDFISYVNALCNKTKSITAKESLNKLLGLDKKLLLLFLKKISVINQSDSVINEIKDIIEEKYIKKVQINNAFNDIFTEMKVRFFQNVNNGEKLIVSFDEWVPCASTIFEKYQCTLLPIMCFEGSLPDKLHEQNFIQELIEIGDIGENDIVEISDYTSYMLSVKMNLDEWYNNGDLTNGEVEAFHNVAKTYWKNKHKKCHRNTKSEIMDFSNALLCLDEIREQELFLDNTLLNIQLSNGEFYYLSNEKMIGWIKKWERKYKE